MCIRDSPIFVLVLALFKVPPVIAMLSSSLLAIIMGAFTQGDHVELIRLIDSAGIGFSIETGVADLDTLLNRGGKMCIRDRSYIMQEVEKRGWQDKANMADR